MKKVLIISYFYPPCNLTAAQRIGSWSKYLPEFGFYPIVVTRNWTGEELTDAQRLTTTNENKLVKTNSSEIHYLQYTSSLRDVFFIYGQKKTLFRYLSKVLTFIYSLLQCFSVRFIPYRNLYQQARLILANDKTIKTLIISGNPFEQFFFGFLLQKEFPDLKWIADYRDDWTTSEIDKFPFKKIHAFFEKKWVRSSNAILSISPYYTQKISSFVGVKGFTLLNGFDNIESLDNPNTDTNSFILTYNGTLYATQPIEVFLEGFKKFITQNPQVNIHLNFPGLLIDKTQANRVSKALQGYEQNYIITERVSRQEVLTLQEKSDLLVMVAHKNIKGVPSSKIFEYIGLRKPFIVCPGDGDILDDIARSCNLGNVLNSKEAVFLFLQEKIQEKRESIFVEKFKDTNITMFSAKKQVELLSNLLNQISSE